MKNTSNTMMFMVGIVFAGVFVLSGCSKSTDTDTNTSGLLTRSMTDIDDRFERHDHIMWSDSTFAGRWGEMQHYVDDLDSLFDHMGEMLAEMEDCHMATGGHMMGGGTRDSVCPSFDRVDDLREEYLRHFDEMDDILHNRDDEGFSDEMGEHFGNMHSYMDSMKYYLDDEHNTEMMHGHNDGDDDGDNDHGYGHGHGGW